MILTENKVSDARSYGCSDFPSCRGWRFSTWE